MFGNKNNWQPTGFILVLCLGLASISSPSSGQSCVPYKGSPATGGKCDSIVTYSNVYLASGKTLDQVPLSLPFLLFVQCYFPWPFSYALGSGYGRLMLRLLKAPSSLALSCLQSVEQLPSIWSAYPTFPSAQSLRLVSQVFSKCSLRVVWIHAATHIPMCHVIYVQCCLLAGQCVRTCWPSVQAISQSMASRRGFQTAVWWTTLLASRFLHSHQTLQVIAFQLLNKLVRRNKHTPSSRRLIGQELFDTNLASLSALYALLAHHNHHQQKQPLQTTHQPHLTLKWTAPTLWILIKMDLQMTFWIYALCLALYLTSLKANCGAATLACWSFQA